MNVNYLGLVQLTPLMEMTSGKPEIAIGLVDGPVAINHPDLAPDNIREIRRASHADHAKINGVAYMHGTFVAGILSARRGSPAPAICPDCTLLVRPIFGGTAGESGDLPSATPAELAGAIEECIKAGGRVINLSAALGQPSIRDENDLKEVLDFAAERDVIVIAAAGNQGTLGSSTITRHVSVIPVIAYDLDGRPTNDSNLGSSIGKRGLGAPGTGVTSLGTSSKPIIAGGTSVAAPFVTGAVALLWSTFPAATATHIKWAVTQMHVRRRASVVPPLLNAWEAYKSLKQLLN